MTPINTSIHLNHIAKKLQTKTGSITANGTSSMLTGTRSVEPVNQVLLRKKMYVLENAISISKPVIMVNTVNMTLGISLLGSVVRRLWGIVRFGRFMPPKRFVRPVLMGLSWIWAIEQGACQKWMTGSSRIDVWWGKNNFWGGEGLVWGAAPK